MTLPVSSYEELLVRVRSLTHETIQLRRELSSSLADPENVGDHGLGELPGAIGYATHPQRTSDLRRLAMDVGQVRNRNHDLTVEDLDIGGLKIGDLRPTRPTTLFPKTKENEAEEELKDIDEKRTSPELGTDQTLPRSDWGPESLGLWHSGPSSLGFGNPPNNNQDASSVISFSSSVCSGTTGAALPRRAYSHQQLGAKVEMVYNLLSMLGTSDREDMSKTLLAMSSTAESCQAMRQSGCLPLLIQLIHANELERAVRARAAEALHNIVQAQADDKRKRRESRVLKLLQTVREHCDLLKTDKEAVEAEKHPGAAVAALMKFSFDAEHRQAMCTLGGLHAIAELIQLEHDAHGSVTEELQCVTLRRYAGMALTNLTFGDGANKALLCSFTKFMEALVAQLTSPSEDLRQVTASVIRNLSWRADAPSKTNLREVGAVTALMTAAMEAKKEATLKSILSALWNLSAHCSMNKVDICSVSGALAFLVRTLRYKASSSTLGIIENAGGILRNVSSHVAVREDYRQILRDAGCFEVLLEQLKSPSLTVVSNACGTLWNLSARCAEDQRRLWDMGATSMLRSLVQSKHKMIAMGSSAALKNLLAANPTGNMMAHLDSTAKTLGLQNLPTLSARKQRALEQELDATLAETCENIELEERARGLAPKRSDSKESVTSTHSDSVYERVARGTGKVLDNKNVTLHDSLSETGGGSGRRTEEAKLLKRYRASGIPTPPSRKPNPPKEETQSAVKPARRGIPVLKNARYRPRGDSTSPSPRFQPASLQCPNESEEESGDCPIDYSQKYAETTESLDAKSQSTSGFKRFNGVPKTEEVPPAAAATSAYYAETDLDQPTDFSLKYGEEVSSDDDIAAQRFAFYDSNKNETEDTTRTYYTEGTPYEGTPYNFSSANSMSDLRVDPAEVDGKVVGGKQKEEPCEPFESVVSSPGHPTGMSTPAEKRTGVCTPERLPSEEKTRVYASGISTPEPSHGKASRSFESGVSTPERPVQYCEEGTPGDCISRVSSLSSLSGGKESSKISPGKKEPAKEQKKLVTFTETITETPLMFSRSSSLTSLNSLAPPLPDQDGGSSVVSSFSRVTSGAISPSDLPDSPTQTVPPSVRGIPPASESVFDDCVERYKQEGTPIEFSRQTSLSCLTFESSNSSVCEEEVKTKDLRADDQTVPERNSSDRLELSSVSEGDEDVDEHILADCINIGMLDTRNRPRPSTKIVTKVPKPRVSIPVKSPRGIYEDSIQTYHTEDTPANISHAGSNSDLSILTVPEQNEDISANSSDTENILNECIHSGMPQGKPKDVIKKSVGINSAMGLRIGKQVAAITPVSKTLRQPEQKRNLHPASDEVITFVTENSPCTFSTRSSLSDLTVNTESPGPTPLRSGLMMSPALNTTSQGASPGTNSLLEFEDEGKAFEDQKRDLEQIGDTWDGKALSHPNTRDASFASVASSEAGQGASVSDDLVTALSRSLSIESFESCEPTALEQALLEQCIHSGMPHRPKNGPGASAATSDTHTDTAADGNAKERKQGLDVMTGSVGTHTWSDEVSISASLGSGSTSDGTDCLRVLDSPRPHFKVGAGVTPLSKDTSRICREIRRLQEEQLQVSITNEQSLASYDSFLDVDVVSGLELPDRQTPDFLASEEHPVTQKLLKMKNETLSMPSLGPVMPGNHFDFDLEASMISVASITSEIADEPTLNAEGSDTEVPEDDDLSSHSQDELPTDPPPRKLTPKEKRQISQDRYLTYTLDELKAKCLAEGEAPPKPRLTPKQRRLNDRDRFLTRTISLEEKPAPAPVPEMNCGTYRIRKDKDRKRTGSLFTQRAHNNGTEGLTHAMKLELVANATLVAQVLTAESDISINTDTYVSAGPVEPRALHQTEEKTEYEIDCVDDDLRCNSDCENESGDEGMRGPRITVPGAELLKEPEEAKAIRGRRKALYSSPVKKVVATSPKKAVRVAGVGGSASSSPSKLAKPKTAIPPAFQPPPLVREGTFTKEEGTTGKQSRLPEAKSTVPRPGIPRPASSGLPGPAAQTRTKSVPRPTSSIAATAAAHKRHSSAGAQNASQTTAINVTKRHSSTGVPSMKNSASNQSIKSVGSVKCANSTPPSASPEKTDKNKQASAKPKTPKKEVTSKIASLWKKVEETKKKEKGAKDSRVWITANKRTENGVGKEEEEEVLVIEQEEILELNSGKIVRSSTFQGDVPRAKAHDQRLKGVRNSGDFSTWEPGRSESRSVVSAIVPPYNYSPPAPKVTSDLKTHNSSSNYHKKVTTV